MKIIRLLLIAIAMIASYTLTAQVSITSDGTDPDGSAMLDVKSTNRGLLLPRMTLYEIAAIANPADGLTVYNTTDHRFYFYDDNAGEWKEMAIASGTITPYTLQVGDNYGGGIVFYIDGTGEHGLVCDTSIHSTELQWTTSAYYAVTVPGGATSLTDGLANSTAIVAQAGVGDTYAAGLCDGLISGIYTDWFLPSQDELNLMYQNIGPGDAFGLGNIGGFASAYYWSSSEASSDYARKQHFGFGGQGSSDKSGTSMVCAIRAF